MGLLDIFAGGKPMTIGDLEFPKITGLSGADHLEENETKNVSDNIKMTAWLYSESQRNDFHNWESEIDFTEKLKEFEQLYHSKEIHDIVHAGLNALGIRFVKLVRKSWEFQEDVVVVSMDLKPYNTKEEKELKRNPPALKDAGTTEDTQTSSAYKSSQGEQEKGLLFDLLKKADDFVGKIAS